MGGRKTKTRKVREIPLSEQLSNEELLQALETMVKALNVELRYEKGDFSGGACRIYDQSLVVLQKNDSAKKKIVALSHYLSQVSLEGIYVPPAVREVMMRFGVSSDTNDSVLLEEE